MNKYFRFKRRKKQVLPFIFISLCTMDKSYACSKSLRSGLLPNPMRMTRSKVILSLLRVAERASGPIPHLKTPPTLAPLALARVTDRLAMLWQHMNTVMNVSAK
jgi:hypothetical protein